MTGVGLCGNTQCFQYTLLVLSGHRNGKIVVRSQDMPYFSAGDHQAINTSEGNHPSSKAKSG